MSHTKQPTIIQSTQGDLLDFIVQQEYHGLPVGSLKDGTYQLINADPRASMLIGGNPADHLAVSAGSYRYQFDDSAWRGVVLKGPKPQYYDDPMAMTAPGGGDNAVPEPISMVIWSCVLAISCLVTVVHRRFRRKR